MSSEVKLKTRNDLIQDLLNFNVDPNLHPTDDLRETPPEFPIHFYDRHLDTHLSLARVKVVPALINMLSDFCNQELERFKSKSKAVMPPQRIMEQPTQMMCSLDYANLYGERISQYCSYFPSALYLHPDSEAWESVTTYTTRRSSRNRRTTFVTEGYASIELLYTVPYDSDRAENGMYLPDESGVRKLYEMDTHSSSLALAHFYPLNMHGEKLINQINDVTSFKWQTSYATLPQHIPHQSQQCVDAHEGFVARFVDKRVRPIPVGRKTVKRKNSPTATLSVARRDPNSEKPYRVDWRDFVQHVWAQAVAEDVTFIILTCGKYERIGIRHRSSRTLFLSDIIKSTTCKSPSYGKIHLALHFAILEDALARHQARKLANIRPTAVPPTVITNNTRVNLKRGHNRGSLELHRPAKRAKESRYDDEFLQRKIEALSTRDLYFVSLNYGVHQSPAPSSFIRKGPSCAKGFCTSSRGFTPPKRRKVYHDHEYVSLSLAEPLNSGATGTAHRAVARFCLGPGETADHPVVIKLVFLDRVKRHRNEPTYSTRLEEERLLHEYSIYQHLSSVGTFDGILPIFGLFEDIDSGTLALVMGDGGTSIQDLRKRSENKFSLTDPERQNLIYIMQKIHEAGVRHCDIWPTNILKGEGNQLSIIDFDMAQLLAYPSEKMKREMQKLTNITEGTDEDEEVFLYSF